ncbi:helix-turn-helix domain-containing protein [Ammoniphilus sp. YIM 78166]|uniref:helix-turn-helix domain-containing protein n=1 Tax=Ammoniphilus sp. YIM 78166 TaxID=1644106 RepID=UPI001070288E|nr:helix-turn-helix domain-containing protein [Ammoniphilus sp. YIM 78166]
MDRDLGVIQYIDRKLTNIPFQIWLCKPQHTEPVLIYKKGMEFQPLPFPSVRAEDKFCFQEFEGKSILSLFYPDHYQVVLSMFDQKIVLQQEDFEQLHLLFSVLVAQEEVQRKSKELVSMVESIRSITSSLDLDELLTKIITNALAVIPTAHAGFLQLYDAEKGYLIPKTEVGFNQDIYSLKIGVGESITGKVFQDGCPRLYNSRTEIYQNMSNISQDNFLKLHSNENSKKVNVLASVPVSLGEKRIGVLTIHQYEGKLTQHDVDLLQAFADQAAIAIQNAQLHSEVNKRLGEVTHLTNQLKEKNHFLLKRNEIHDTLTELSLYNQGGDMILTEMARMMDRTVFFFDALETEYFPKHQKHRPPLSLDEISRLSFHRRKPVFIDLVDKGHQSLYTYPIFSGTIFLGCIITPLDKPLSQLDRITIEQGSSILALELVKKRTQAEVYYKRTHEMFNELIQTTDHEHLVNKGKELGLNPSSLFMLAVFEMTSYQDLQTLGADNYRLANQIKKAQKDSLIIGCHNKVIVVFSLLDQHHIKETLKNIYSIMKEWTSRDNPPLRVGISNPYEGIKKMTNSYEEANKVLLYLESRNRLGMMKYDEMGINRLFLNQQPTEIQHFTQEILAPLRTEKAISNDLERTLFTYIHSNRSNVQTAEKLHIHTNTLYQRIKKIEELLNLHFDDPEDWLKVLLAFHLRETFGYSSPVRAKTHA